MHKKLHVSLLAAAVAPFITLCAEEAHVPYALECSTQDVSDKVASHLLSIGAVAATKNTKKEKNRKKKKNNHLRLTKKDHLPIEMLEGETICYLEGYIQALIDANYYENYVIVEVVERGGEKVVFLYNLPSDERIKNSILAFVRDLPGISKVQEKKLTKEEAEKVKEQRFDYHLFGVWFPESTVVFKPVIANPRDPVYSIAYRWGDYVIAENQIAISLGDVFPIYRFFDVFGGDMQIDIAACMWADFNMDPEVHPNGEWAELVTTDYILAIPISYARDIYSFRLRAYHISSHLGDEYLVNQPDVIRTNPSFEAIDFFVSIQLKDAFRVYFAPGFIVHSDESYPMKVLYFEYGFEFRPFAHKYEHPRLYGNPFFALDCQNWEVNNYRPSLTMQLGYEWNKLERAGRSVRLFVEYHNGYSEGQFFYETTSYWALRAAWGF